VPSSVPAGSHDPTIVLSVAVIPPWSDGPQNWQVEQSLFTLGCIVPLFPEPAQLLRFTNHAAWILGTGVAVFANASTAEAG
jgi:hypothetical protein